MFGPHKAQINISRAEPDGLDLELAIKRAKRRNTLYAKKVVTKDILKKRPANKSASEKRIRKSHEFEERLRRCGTFIELWNYWRNFYTPERHWNGLWAPKSPSQLTVIEHIQTYCRQNEIDLGLLVATTWKNFQNSKRFVPTVQMCLSNATEYYNQWHDDVVADIRDAEYLEDALL